MNKKIKRVAFTAVLTSCFLISGCSKKVPQFMKYGNGGIGELSYKTEQDSSELFKELMANDLSVITEKKTKKLNNDPHFNAAAVFVSNETANEVLYAENCFKKLYPASLTKLMTAYVAYKHGGDLSRETVVTAEARKMSDPYAKVMGLLTDDHITLETLLNCVLVHSSNDAAKALAIAISGSEEEFVGLMNKEALFLGAVKTNFTNCHGLHDEANYTTLYDLYLIFHALLKNDHFLKIVGQSKYEAKYKNGLGAEVSKILNSTNQYFTGLQHVPKGYTILGGKTGTTDEAGYCMLLYSSAADGNKYVTGILKASDTLNLYAGFSTIFENIPR